MSANSIGPYRLLEKLGEGGMGEVYKAHDARLNRDVAIKILLPAVADDPERVQRFSREAQVLASLNHSNIAHLYGLEEAGGVTALVLELVDGPTLADRIAQGPLAIDEALPIARQIADALEAAHEQGVVHRDLKPANIKIKPDGTVKVLDFGLAKMLAPPEAISGQSSSPSESPTMTARATEAGLILGTAAYMAPEQARSKAVDKRCDIWAFGCVLFEMITGHRAFPGETVSDTIAAVLAREPEWNRLPTATPATVRHVLQRCLEKDPRRRIRDIGDVRFELDGGTAGSTTDLSEALGVSRRRERWGWIAALAVVVAAAAAAIAVLAPRSPSAPAELRLEVTTPATNDPTSLSISPDGKKIVFTASSEDGPVLWLRSLYASSAQRLLGTEGGRLPFWSPDSRSIGFFADGRLRRIDIDGGSPTILATAPFGRGGAWNRDGTIIFAATPAEPLSRISSTGGDPQRFTTLAPRTVSHCLPQFLPDGRHFLYYVDGAPDLRGVYVGALDDSPPTRLFDADSAAVYASGHVFFVRQGTLLAQAFDAAPRTVTGEPFAVAPGISMDRPLAAFSVSETGTVVYRTGSIAEVRQFQWFDESGKQLATVGDPATELVGLSLSRDDRRIAFFTRETGNAEIWLLDTARGVRTRLTSDAGDDLFPTWSPDNTQIAFSSTRNQSLDVYLKPASGIGGEQLLMATPEIKAVTDWSADGRFLIYSVNSPQTGFDIWGRELQGDRKSFALLQTPFNERLAQFSPNGKWIAYESNESGRYEIYLQPFSGAEKADTKLTVSRTGGVQVRWRRDGKALFYLALDDRLMMVPIAETGDGRTIEPGTPVPLFGTRTRGAVQPFPRYQYAVSADGHRFLMAVDLREAAQAPLAVILNWSDTR